MQKTQKKKRSIEEWKHRMSDWERSGKTISVWCEEEGESFHSFKYWRRILSGNYNRFPPLPTIQKSSFRELPREVEEIPSTNDIQFIINTLLICVKTLRGLTCFQ